MIAKNILLTSDSEELIKPIFPGYPVSIFQTNFSPSTYHYVNWHWHQAFQYCLVTEGSICVQVPHHKYILRQGDGIFIGYMCSHQIQEESPVSSYICFVIPPTSICADTSNRIYTRYLKTVADNLTLENIIFRGSDTESQEVLDAMNSIQNSLNESIDMPEIEIQIQILRLWRATFRMLKQLDSTPQEDKDNSRLRTILHYLELHYSEKITLEDIAHIVSLSKGECCRFFNKVTGQSLFSYLIQLRINESLVLLRDTDRSIIDIASAVGFGSQSYYTECFRKSKSQVQICV